jgi:hypothetical protein
MADYLARLALRPLEFAPRPVDHTPRQSRIERSQAPRQATRNEPSLRDNDYPSNTSSLKRSSTLIRRAVKLTGGVRPPADPEPDAHGRHQTSTSVYHTISGKKVNDVGLIGDRLLPRDAIVVHPFSS